ncbi:MAG: hypothetical protein NT124_00630 [Candidatus Dependentiae bacterium]|nr:hypothetical protein [Candidatus Dependentiae bacterium]
MSKKIISKKIKLIISIFAIFCCMLPQQKLNAKPESLDLEQMMKNDPAYQNMSQQEKDEITKLSQQLQDPETIAKIERMVPDMEKAIADLGGEEALKSMSEEDFTSFITDFATEWEEKDKINQQAKKTPAPKAAIKEKPKAADTVTLSGKELLQANINTIIIHIDSLFAKVPSMPEFPGKIETWAKQGIMTEWGSSATWNTVKKYIELLESKLKIIISVDKITGKQRYLDYIYENEALRNHIQLLKVKLVENESLIDVSTFGLTKQFGAKSKKAAQKTVSCLGEAVEKLKMIEAINSAIEKHEPLAKEMREQEATLRKQAEQEAKKKPVISKASQTSGASAGSATSGYQPSSYQEQYYPSYPSHSSSSYSSPRNSRRYSSGSENMSNKSGSGSGNSGRKAAATSGDTKEQSNKADTKKNNPIASEDSKKMNQLINTFEDAIDAIVEIKDENNLVKKLEESKKIGKIASKTKEAVSQITDAVIDATEAVSDLRNVSVADHKPYQKMVQKNKEKIEPLFGKIHDIYKADIEKYENEKNAAVQDMEKAYKTIEKAEQIVASTRSSADDKTKAQEDLREANADKLLADTAFKSAEKELLKAVPAEIITMLEKYDKLNRKIKQFAKPKKKITSWEPIASAPASKDASIKQIAKAA